MRQLTVLLILLGAVVGLYLLLGQDDVAPTGPVENAGDEATTAPDEEVPGLDGSAETELLQAGELPQGIRTIRVRVVDPTGTPHVGVPVVLNRSAEDEELREPSRLTPVARLERHLEWERSDWTSVRTGTTDEEGRVRFQALATGVPYVAVATPSPLLHPNQVWIDGGRHIAGFRVAIEKETTLVLGAGPPLRVRVVDERGKGIVARVQLDGWVEPPQGEPYWTKQTIRTDATGRWAFDPAPVGTLRATVFVPGHATAGPIEIQTPARDEVLLRVGISGGAVLRGVVRNLRGQPVVGAVVLLGLRATPPAEVPFVQRLVHADGSGSYHIAGLPAGRIEALAVAAEDHLFRRNLGGEQQLSAGEERVIDVVLPRASVIEGHVRDEAGAPVAGARVEAKANDHAHGLFQTFESSDTYTDAKGGFRLLAVPPGTGTVIARKAGYIRIPDAKPPPSHYEIAEPGQTVRVSVVLRRGIPVSGTVVDAQDAPVAGAEVVAGVTAGQDPWSLQRREVTKTDESGAFTLPGLQSGKRYLVRARGPAGFSAPHELEMPTEGAPGLINLVLLEGGVLAGRLVVSGEGKVDNRSIQLRMVDSQFQMYATTDDEGAFRFGGLPAATYRLTPPQTVYMQTRVRRGEADAGGLEVRLAAGEHREDLQIEVPPTKRLAGLVVDEDGKPYSNLFLKISWSRDGHSGSHGAPTNRQGRFRFPYLPAGSYKLSANNQELGTFEAGETALRLTVDRKTKAEVPQLEVRVRLPDGTPAPTGSGQLRLMQGTGYIQASGFAIQDGRARVRIPKPRKNTRPVLVILRAGDLFGRALNIRPAAIDPVDLTLPAVEVQLEAGLAIAGQVVDEGGEPLSGFVVALTPKEQAGHDSPRATTDADGRFAIDSLPDAEWILLVQVGSSGYMVEAGRSVKSGDQDVRVVLQKGGVIKGEAYGPNGKPLASAQVTWQAEAVPGQQGSGRYGHARTDHLGRFTLQGLQPGLAGTLYVWPANPQRSQAMRTVVSRIRVGDTRVRVDLDRGQFLEGTYEVPAVTLLGHLTFFLRGKGANQHLSASGIGKDGKFRVGPVPAGEYVLQAMGGGLPQQDPIDVVVPSSGTVVKFEAGVVLSGKLLVEDPQGFIATWIQYDSDGNVIVSQSTGFQADGRFRIPLREDATGLLYVGHNLDDRMTLLKRVKPSDGPFDVRVGTGQSIEGRVEGLPDNVGHAYVQTTGWLVRGTQVAKDGAFKIRGLPPGSYDLTVWAGTRRASGSQVAAGSSDVVLTLGDPK